MSNLIHRNGVDQENPFSEIIRRRFNQQGRESIQAGAVKIPVMCLDNKIVSMTVTQKDEDAAVLSDGKQNWGIDLRD